MMEPKNPTLRWQRSTFCTNTGCVEVAFRGDAVLVRDSENPLGSALVISLENWSTFVHMLCR
jgi:Domain of unknown function (DUF397)